MSKTPARFLMNENDFLSFFNDSNFNLKILNMFQFKKNPIKFWVRDLENIYFCILNLLLLLYLEICQQNQIWV